MTTLTPDQQRAISAAYLAGHAPNEIARARHIPRADVEAALDATATPRRKRGGPRLSTAEACDQRDARTARILQLDAERWTVTEIMAEVGLQRAAVCKVLRQVHGARKAATDTEIVALRQQGVAVDTIIETLHVSHQRVIRVLSAVGLAPVPPPDLAERVAEIIRRRRAGEHPKAIAADLGVAESTVYRALKGATGLPPLRQPRPRVPKPAKQPKAPKALPLKAAPAPPALLERQHRPGLPLEQSTPPTIPTRRMCPHCRTPIHMNNWADHQREVHGPPQARTHAADVPPAYVPAPTPQRPPEPPCEVCGLTPCPTPLSHGRIARARAQHGYAPTQRSHR